MEEEKKIVEGFAAHMLDKIQERHNRYAPLGWKTMDMKRLLTLLKGELAELEEKGADMKDEAIDVANYAMFIYEKANDTNTED